MESSLGTLASGFLILPLPRPGIPSNLLKPPWLSEPPDPPMISMGILTSPRPQASRTWRLLAQLVLQTCDTLDGLTDKMIFNTAACKQAFNPATITQLQCTAAKTPTCLLPAQIAAIQNVFAGPVDSQGNALYSNWPYDVGISDPKWLMWPLASLSPCVYIPVGYPQPVLAPIPVPASPAANITQGAQSAMYLFSTPPDPSLNLFTRRWTISKAPECHELHIYTVCRVLYGGELDKPGYVHGPRRKDHLLPRGERSCVLDV